MLYHLQKPINFLCDLLNVSDSVYLWTHFYGESISSLSNGQEKHFVPSLDRSFFFEGVDFSLHARSYLVPNYESSDLGIWQGGLENITYWMKRDQILLLIKMLGFEVVALGDESTVNGLPCFDLVARRVQ